MRTDLILLGYLIVNVAVFLLYGFDKWKAIKQKWRVPEKTLMLAAVFGVFGAAFGMLVFRHKIRKPKFYIGIPLLLIAETIVYIVLHK